MSQSSFADLGVSRAVVDALARGGINDPFHIQRLVIGEVRHIHVRDHLLDARFRVDADKLAAIGRMAGNDYVRTRDRFEIRTAGR